MKVLIPGISGLLGQLVAKRLLENGHSVFGIDRRTWPNAPDGVEIFEGDIRKRPATDVFRKIRPDVVVHMATVTHLRVRSDDRYRINLLGTRAVFDNCHQYGAKRAIFVGRHTYYGAAADSPVYHTEEDPPMAATTFPELADLVAADLYAGSALWRYPKIDTLVLRACYSLGPLGHGTLSSFLRNRYVPLVLGFDPLFQLMHESDAANAIALAVDKGERGVYNVAGPPPVHFSELIREAGRTPVRIPETLLRLVMGRFGLPGIPVGALTHLKYPVVVDATAFAANTGFKHEHDAAHAIGDFARAFPLT